MKWMKLLLAAFFEVFWAVCMNYSQGFSKLVPSILTCVGYILSAVFLAWAMKEIPLGTAYAIWTGIGIVGTSVLGVVLFHDKMSLPQVICVLLIVIGVIGLKLLAKD